MVSTGGKAGRRGAGGMRGGWGGGVGCSWRPWVQREEAGKQRRGTTPPPVWVGVTLGADRTSRALAGPRRCPPPPTWPQSPRAQRLQA